MERELERRFNALVILVVFVFVTLFGRVGYLQIIQRERYEKLAEGNRIRLIPTDAPRGVIYDRNGTPVVDSRPAYTVSLIPLGQEIDPAVLDRLAGILGITRADLDQIIKDRAGRPYDPIRIASDISPEIYTKIEEDKYELPGVVVDVQPVRDYVNGAFASQILGYVREISDTQLKGLQAKGQTDYKMGDIYGQMGVENKLDQYLRGVAGGRQVEVDSMGRPVRIVGEQAAVPGDDVTLTLDAQLQAVAEKAMNDSFKNLQAQGRNAQSGAVVVENVKTGEILAIASFPTFDPNVFNGILTPEMTAQLFQNPLNPFNNRVFTGTYSPGSVFKMAVAAAALQEGKTTPNETIYDPGYYYIGPTRKGCWVPSGHGTQNIIQALQNSCNVFFYQMGLRLGPDLMNKYASEFGFGQATGIDLPGERAGILPSTAWKQQAAASGLVAGDGKWWPAETADMAIGQGFDSFTLLQVVNYISTIANGGTRYQPYIINQVRDASGKVIQQTTPKVLNTIGVSKENMDVVRQGMLAVASAGTAAWVFQNYPITVAGKTGTAETGHGNQNNGLFVAYAPYDDPQIAVATIVENGGHGSTSGAPVAKAIFDQYFHLNQPASGGATVSQSSNQTTQNNPTSPTTPSTPSGTVTTPSGGNGSTTPTTPAEPGTPASGGTQVPTGNEGTQDPTGNGGTQPTGGGNTSPESGNGTGGTPTGPGHSP